jgi:hypothetical protein
MATSEACASHTPGETCVYDDNTESSCFWCSFANNSSGNGDASDGFADPFSLIVSPVSDEEAQQNSPSLFK